MLVVQRLSEPLEHPQSTEINTTAMSLRWREQPALSFSVSLPTPTVGSRRGYGFQRPLSVCLFFRSISLKPLQVDHQTWHRNVPPWFPKTYLFWGKKCQRSRSRDIQKTVTAWYFVLFLWVPAFSSSFYRSAICYIAYRMSRKLVVGYFGQKLLLYLCQ